MPDPILKTSAAQAVPHFERAGAGLVLRQAKGGISRGNVAPWPGCADDDFHGTLAAIWVWSRYQALAGDPRFAGNRDAAWSFVEGVWRQFIPEAIGPEAASDEAAYDCAMVLRAALGERAIGGATGARGALIGGAARVLAAYLADLDDLSGRDFQDPGFAAWNLIDYARAVEDRGLLSAGRRFVERAFGMKAPQIFTSEPEPPGRLFDFSSTIATRVSAIISSEGNTPFVGAWLRERVVSAIPMGFATRARDENCWNACVAAVMGRAYVVSTDPVFLERHRIICSELARRDTASDAGLGRGGALVGAMPGPDTLATFYYALATDALVRSEGAVSDITPHNTHQHGQGHAR
ncbi:MAG: hypothetical protein H7X95_06485 [Deltaproteobacteria bacterium]|nr:hypothetical protein [Deltaproteobacteria bacterium]